MEAGERLGLTAATPRERALEAMADLCAERGYAALAESEVAARAGISEAAFAGLFTSKEDCAIALENQLLGEVVAAVSAGYSADRSEWESVLRGVKAILEVMAARPSFAYFGYVVARQMSSPRVFGVYATGHQVLGAMLERGWAYSDSELQPVQTAMGALGGGEAVVRREVAAGRARELPRLLPDIAYAAGVAFLGQEEGLRQARRARALLREDGWGEDYGHR